MNTIDALVDDELWEIVGPLLPPEPVKPKGGRPRMPPRAVFSGIVYVLKTGIPWGLLPKEFGCSGGTWAKPFAGDVYATGEKRGCSSGCTGFCSIGWAGQAG